MSNPAAYYTRLEFSDIVVGTPKRLTSALGVSLKTGAAIAAGKVLVGVRNELNGTLNLAYGEAAKTAAKWDPLAKQMGRDLRENEGAAAGDIWADRPAASSAGHIILMWRD